MIEVIKSDSGLTQQQAEDYYNKVIIPNAGFYGQLLTPLTNVASLRSQITTGLGYISEGFRQDIEAFKQKGIIGIIEGGQKEGIIIPIASSAIDSTLTELSTSKSYQEYADAGYNIVSFQKSINEINQQSSIDYFVQGNGVTLDISEHNSPITKLEVSTGESDIVSVNNGGFVMNFNAGKMNTDRRLNIMQEQP